MSPDLCVVSSRPVSVSKNGKVKARKRKRNDLSVLASAIPGFYPGGQKKLTKDATTDPYAKKRKRKPKAKKRNAKRKAAPKKRRRANPHRLKGRLAIAYAEKHGMTLKKYADPTQGARTGLSPSEANRIAREDPSLIYLDTPKRKRKVNAKRKTTKKRKTNARKTTRVTKKRKTAKKRTRR